VRSYLLLLLLLLPELPSYVLPAAAENTINSRYSLQ
jgi:hypothetical protein